MRMLANCLQQDVRVGLVEFGERHDTGTNNIQYTQQYTPQRTAGPTNQVSEWQAKTGKWPDTPDTHDILARMSRVSDVSTRMSRECYADATRKLLPWNLSSNALTTITGRHRTHTVDTRSLLFS